eukprot:Awhi_evm1s2299
MKIIPCFALVALALTCDLVTAMTFRPTLCSRWAENNSCPKNKVLKDDCEWCFPAKNYFRKKDRCKRRCCEREEKDMGFYCVANPEVEDNSFTDAQCHEQCLDGEEKEYCSYNSEDNSPSNAYFISLNPDDVEHDTGPCRTEEGSSGSDGDEYTLYPSKNIEECRQICLDDDTCVAFEAKLNSNHNRCEIWHVVPEYAKKDADSYTCELKQVRHVCNCRETPEVAYTCASLVESVDPSMTNKQCQNICTASYNHEQCLYAGFFPQSPDQVCSCVTDFKCTVEEYQKPDYVCDGRAPVDHELGSIFDKQCLSLNLVMAGCGESDQFNPYRWIVKKGDDSTLDDVPKWSNDQDEYCLQTCLRSSFHENPYFDFLFVMPTGHEECYYQKRNQFDGGDWDESNSAWDGKLFLAQNHLNRNDYDIQYIEEGDFKTEADEVTKCAVFGIPFSDGEE